MRLHFCLADAEISASMFEMAIREDLREGSMTIEERTVGSMVVLDVSGRITLGDGEGLLKEAVTNLLKQGRANLLLNMAEVSYVDSSGLGALVGSSLAAKRPGRSGQTPQSVQAALRSAVDVPASAGHRGLRFGGTGPRKLRAEPPRRDVKGIPPRPLADAEKQGIIFRLHHFHGNAVPSLRSCVRLDAPTLADGNRLHLFNKKASCHCQSDADKMLICHKLSSSSDSGRR